MITDIRYGGGMNAVLSRAHTLISSPTFRKFSLSEGSLPTKRIKKIEILLPIYVELISTISEF